MPNRTKTQRWFRLRLRTLFLVVTLAAICVWIWPKLGIEIVRSPHQGSRVLIFWGGETWRLYDPVGERERQRIKQAAEKQTLKALARKEREAAARRQELQLDVMETSRSLEGPVEK